LDAALKPLERAVYSERDRRPVAAVLTELRTQAAALQPPSAEFENAVAEALKEEDKFWKNAPDAGAQFPAPTAEPLRRRARELSSLFSGLFPDHAPAGVPASPGKTPIPASAESPPESAVKAAAGSKKAEADPRLFFDGSGARRDVSFGSAGGGPSDGRASAGDATRSALAKRGIVLRAPIRVSDLALGPVPAPEPAPALASAPPVVLPSARAALRSVAARSPAARGLVDALREKRPEKPRVSATEAACREASDGGALAGLCASSATAWTAPVAAGVLDAMKRQFGTVSGVVSLLAFTALGLLLSALSGGVGLLVTVLKALVGFAIFWTVASMIRRVAAALKEYASTRPGDPRHWRALRELGKVGGELLILVLLVFAGYKVGQKPAVKNAVASMTSALRGQMSRLGVRPAAPSAQLRAALGEPAVPAAGNRSNLVPPQPPPVRPTASATPTALQASGRSLANPRSLEGATVDEVVRLIPKDWVTRPMRTGRGTIYEVPGTRGSDIIQ
ncbi:MAG: hypothetical protein NUW21_09870, partial [Elusimicrobia bacterium]|nr:hypothetical protein [Elusimicrobiota bacterium]